MTSILRYTFLVVLVSLLQSERATAAAISCRDIFVSKPIELGLNTQDEIWNLRNQGKIAQASKLEAQVIETLTSGEVVSVEQADGGIFGAKILKFANGLEGIWKSARFPKDGANHEVAAWKVDRQLNLNMVPVTTFREFEGQNGSIQLVVNKIGGLRLFDRPQVLAAFDYLIANLDRNNENYLMLPSGRVALIDHGLSFAPVKGYFNARVEPYFKALDGPESAKATLGLKEIFNNKLFITHLRSTTAKDWSTSLEKLLSQSDLARLHDRQAEILTAADQAEGLLGQSLYGIGPIAPLLREH